MKFTDKTGLLAILDLVKPAVATKDFNSTLKCFHFTKDGIEGYNGETYIKALYTTDMDFIVPSATFYRLISEIPSNAEFEILVDENCVKVKVGNKIEAKFPLITDFSFPNREAGKEDIPFPLSKEILQGLEICLDFIGKDETKPVFRGVYINPEGVFSTDSYRVAHYITPFVGEVFLPEAFCNLLLKHKPEEFYQDETKTSYYFYTSEVLVCTNIANLGESLPNYMGALALTKKAAKGEFIKVNGDMVTACKRVSIFAEGLLDKYCKLQFNPSMVALTVNNSGIGEITEKFSIGKSKYTGEVVTVDLPLFQSILQRSTTFELVPESEEKAFPTILSMGENLEMLLVTLNME